MTPDLLFEITNAIAFFGWILLITFPYKQWTTKTLISIVILLFCIIYAWLIFKSLKPGDLEGFGSLEGIMGLFSDKFAVLAGWIHYLAFDMLAGLYIVNNAKKHMINRWVLIPCLIFTFMLGPFGFLLYLILRTVVTKKYLHPYM